MRPKPRRDLPPIRKTKMMPTYRAPVSRPLADTRRECWGAETADGAWLFERQESERYLKWALIYLLPVEEGTAAPERGTLVTYGSSLRNLRGMIADGSWTTSAHDPTDGIWTELAYYGKPLAHQEFYRKTYGRSEGPPCVVAYWFRGRVLRRRVFGTELEASAWATSEIVKSKRGTRAARAAGEE